MGYARDGFMFVVVLKVADVRVGRGLCWVGGFEVCRCEGGVWVVLCWAVLVVLEVVGVRVRLGPC